jgi:putative ABC transport system permease protein
VDFVSYFVAMVMAIGATLAAINVMYAVVDSRKREIATLLAIGFRSAPIVLSVLIESMLLALPGALLGVLVAWLFFNGNTVSPFGITFHLAVTPLLVSLGILWATVMGILGGITPAIRAARVPVATALRAT